MFGEFLRSVITRNAKVIDSLDDICVYLVVCCSIKIRYIGEDSTKQLLLIFSISFTVVLRFQNIYTDVNFSFTEPYEGNDEYFYSFGLPFQFIY